MKKDKQKWSAYTKWIVGKTFLVGTEDSYSAGWDAGRERTIEQCAIRGRIAQLENKLVDEEIRRLLNEHSI